MIDGIVSIDNISFILVFLEGVLSFFSPCVIPLIPVYMSYLAGNAKQEREDGVITYVRRKVFLHTLFFVMGISFAFFILGMSFTALGNFFYSNKLLFTRIGGILIIMLGLFQLGLFDLKFLQKERKIHINLTNKNVNPFMALVMGFTFSFAWTPCVGPALSSVLIMSSGAKTALVGNLLVIIYSIGFILPFLLLGLFTTQVLDFIKNKKKLVKYTIKIGGIILILIGVMTFTGWMNGVSSYLNSYSGKVQSDSQGIQNKEVTAEPDNTDNIDSDLDVTNDPGSEDDSSIIPAFDFTLTDQYGNEHTLSDYKGKVVFLNFWATWCRPCREEMPHIEELYQEYNLNQEDVIFLGIANPKSEEYPNNVDDEKDEISSFLDKNELTFPTVFDETGEIFENYFITAFPTTFMIDKEGNIFGYVPGKMSKDIMMNVLDQTIQSGEK